MKVSVEQTAWGTCFRVIGLLGLGVACGCMAPPRETETRGDAGFQVPDGYTVEQVAGTDLVEYPMFGIVDDRGRLFLFESIGHIYDSSRQAIDDPRFRINLLEDEDGDGTYDRSTIFADSLSFPQGGVFHEGSLYVTSAPDLLRLADTDGDDVADERELLLSGWVLNINANSVIGPFMGPDGWLYMTSATEGFDITTREGERLKGTTSRIWRSRLDGSDLEWISAGGMANPVELAFMPGGEPLGTFTYFQLPASGLRDAIAYWVEGGVYPRPNANIEADGLPRTGDLMPVVSKFSRVAPSGIMRYRSAFFGPEYRDNLFTAQFNTHRVLRHTVHRDGATFRTEDEVFFRSDHLDFHPTDVFEDADGSLLVIDTGGWFIEGCPLSQVSKPEVKGGIYRIRRTGMPEVEDPYGRRLATEALPPDSLVAYLDDSRPFARDRAVERLIRAGDVAVEPLHRVVQSGGSVTARTEAVFALYRIGTPGALAGARAGLDDPDLQVRVAAARVAGLAGDGAALEQLSVMVRDDEPAARRQAATALGEIGDPRAVPALLAAAETPTDRFVEHAVAYALIVLDTPAPLVRALDGPSAATRKVALIALDQMASMPLRAAHLVPFLGHSDPDLHRTGLWIASRHPEWSGTVLDFLETRLRGGARSDADVQAVHEVLVSFCADAGIQRLVASLMDDAGTTAAGALALVDVMAECEVETLPLAWVSAIGARLDDGEAAVRARAVDLIRLREMTAFNASLDAIVDDAGAPADLRLSALGARLASRPALSGAAFDLLRDQLQNGETARLRHQAAGVLGQAALTESQLLTLARDELPRADGFVVPRLLDAFERGDRSDEVGTALVAALLARPDPDGVPKDRLVGLIDGYPAPVRDAAAPLIARLEQAQSERLARLEALEAGLVKGDIERGRALYYGKATCGTCHAIGETGGRFGPDLTSIGTDRSRHDLLEAIVFPSASFVRDYETYTVETASNRHTGVIREQTPETLVLDVGPEASVRLARADVVSIDPSTTSMMPQGLDRILSVQELSDLMTFLIGQDQHPDTDADLLR